MSKTDLVHIIWMSHILSLTKDLFSAIRVVGDSRRMSRGQFFSEQVRNEM
jgi:hypothetical protein